MSFTSIPVLRSTVLALLCLACASDPKAGGPGTYRGVIVGTGETGTMEVTVGEATSGPFPASGTIVFQTRTVALTGTLDQSKVSLSLASADGYQLTGQSRKQYVFGSFQTTQDSGSFALFLVPADGTPVQSFCGNLNLTSTTGAPPLPFAVTAVAAGAAICVCPSFTLFGRLDSTNTLSCTDTGAAFDGQVNVDAGGRWGTGESYGTWTLQPCGDGSPNGGVNNEADGGTGSSTPDAGVDSAVDGGLDSPSDRGADSPIDLTDSQPLSAPDGETMD
jgi:hypothetical protein